MRHDRSPVHRAKRSVPATLIGVLLGSIALVYAASTTLQWDIIDPTPPSRVRIYRVTGTCPPSIRLPVAQLTIAGVSSAEKTAINGVASNALDGKSTTLWHSAYSTGTPTLPQFLTVDLGAVYQVNGFAYLPRQDGNRNGWIARYEVAVSMDGIGWSDPVAWGTWPADAMEKVLSFTPTPGRYVRLTALSETQGKPYTSAAEVSVIGAALVAPPAVPIGEVAGTIQSYTDTTVPTDSTSCYYAAAMGTDGKESTQSNAREVTPVVTIPPPRQFGALPVGP